MSETAPARPNTRRAMLWLIGLLVLAGAGYGGWRWYGHVDAPQQASGPPPAVPVEGMAASIMDIPIVIMGLGSVQAFNTVTVSSRVDGQILEIAFQEGQMVKEGDLLAQIDPRPFQAALDQATRSRARTRRSSSARRRISSRTNQLVARDFASKQQLDTQQATVECLEAQIQADQAAIDNARDPAELHDDHARRSPAAPAFAWSTRATSCRPPTPAASCRSPRSSRSRWSSRPRRATCRRSTEADGDGPAEGHGPVLQRQGAPRRGDAHPREQPGRRGERDDPPQGGVRRTRTTRCGPASPWIRACSCATLNGVAAVPDTAVQRGPQGLFAYVVKPDNTVEPRPVRSGRITGGKRGDRERVERRRDGRHGRALPPASRSRRFDVTEGSRARETTRQELRRWTAASRHPSSAIPWRPRC